MRKTLETIGLAALAVLVMTTGRALYGPARLPAPIPTHFGLDGRPDAWGSPGMLLVFPVTAVLLYALMSVVARYPLAFNFPVRVTPRNRAQLEGVALDMIAWLKMELACMFAAMEWFAIRVAGHPGQAMPAALMPVALAAIFATVGLHIAAMRRAARR